MFLSRSAPKILITGGSGFIGSALVQHLQTEYNLYYTYNDTKVRFPRAFGRRLDLKSEMRMDEIFTEIRPRILIHTAAMTSIGECEKDWNRTYDINVRATTYLLNHCRRFNTKVIFFSTDLVFEGDQGNYEELDEAFPVNRYGKSKLLAEQIVSDAKHLKPLIFRISLTMGRSPSPSHQGTVGWLKNTLEKGESVSLFTDEYRTPLYLGDLVKIVSVAIKQDMEGTYHLASRDRISRYDLGLKFAETFGYDKDLLIASSLNDYTGPKRPPDVSLKTRKLLDKFLIHPIGVDEMMRRLKEDFDSKGNSQTQPAPLLPPLYE